MATKISLKKMATWLLGEAAVIGVTETIRKGVSDGVDELIRPHAGGRGTNDEYLYSLAEEYAINSNWVTREQAVKIWRVINSYHVDQRKRIIETIGKEARFISKYEKANVEGARIIQMLAPMTEDEIRLFFSHADYTNTLAESLRNLIANPRVQDALTAARNGAADLRQEGGNFLGEVENTLNTPTPLGDLLRFVRGR